MLTFSFSSSFIFKVLFLRCQQRWASRMHHEDLIAENLLNFQLQNAVSLSKECQLHYLS